MAKFDMNAGRRHKSDSSQTEQQVELREKLKQRNQKIDQTVKSDEAGPEEQQPQQPTGMAAEKACFVTIALPESLKRIIEVREQRTAQGKSDYQVCGSSVVPPWTSHRRTDNTGTV